MQVVDPCKNSGCRAVCLDCHFAKKRADDAVGISCHPNIQDVKYAAQVDQRQHVGKQTSRQC